MKLAVHLCRRAGARARGEADHRGGYDPILKQLGRLKVDHITMEFTSPGAGDMSVFKQLPEHVEIGLGCVSCQPGQIDSVETIVESRRDGAEARRAGADHAQPRLRLRPRLGRRGEPRRGLHEAEERSRRGRAAAREVRLTPIGRPRAHNRGPALDRKCCHSTKPATRLAVHSRHGVLPHPGRRRRGICHAASRLV